MFFIASLRLKLLTTYRSSVVLTQSSNDQPRRGLSFKLFCWIYFFMYLFICFLYNTRFELILDRVSLRTSRKLTSYQVYNTVISPCIRPWNVRTSTVSNTHCCHLKHPSTPQTMDSILSISTKCCHPILLFLWCDITTLCPS